MSEDDFTVRPTRPDDGPALNDLYRRLTGIERSTKQWRWEWFDCPGGPAPSWVIVERANDRVVGHHGVIPVPLLYGAQQLRAARTENTMVDPQARRRIVYPPIEARLLSELLQQFDLIFTTSGKGTHGLLRKRLGYRSAGFWRTFVISMTPSYVAHRLAGPVFGRLALPFGFMSARAQAGTTIDEDCDLSEIAELCASWRDTGGIAPQRTADSLRWRLSGHAYHRIKIGVLRQHGRALAFLAWRSSTGPNGTREIQIEDICAKDNAPELFSAAFSALSFSCRTEPVRITLRILNNDRPLAHAAAIRAAAYPRGDAGDGTELLVRANQGEAPLPWDATMFLAQGI